MKATTRMRSLALSAIATAMLVIAPAAVGQEPGPSTGTTGTGDAPTAGSGDLGNVGVRPPEFPVAKLCHRLANDPRLNASQHATVVAACRQLKSDLQTAFGNLTAAVNAAKAEFNAARQAAISACSNGQFDSQACRDARANALQVRQQAMQELIAARNQFQQDVKAAFATFKSTLSPLKASLQGGGSGGGGN